MSTVERVKAKTRPRKQRRIHAEIKRLREALGLKQHDLAKKSGVDKTAVSHWETGKSSPRGWRLPIVAAALGVTVDALLSEVRR
jgi:transcriptional regulator with XRE-family HTH domain